MSVGVPPVPPPATGAPAPAEGGGADKAGTARAAPRSDVPPAARGGPAPDTLAAGAHVEPTRLVAPEPLPAALALLAPGARVAGTIAPDADGAMVVFKTANAAAAVLATTPVAPATHAVLEVIGAEQRLIAVAVGADPPSAEAVPASAVVLAPQSGPASADADEPATLPPALAALPRGAVVVGTVVPLPEAGSGLLVTDQGVVRIETVPAQAGIAPVSPGDAALAAHAGERSGPVPPRLVRAGTGLALEVVDSARHVIARQVSPARAGPARLTLAPPAGVALAHARARAIAAAGDKAVLAPGRTITGTVVEVATPRRRAPVPAQPGVAPPAPLVQPKGAPITLRLLGYATPRVPAKAAITATVVGHGRDGLLLVDMADRTVALATDAPLPPGTPLLFEPIPPAAADMTPGALPSAERTARSPAVATVAEMAAHPSAGAAVAVRVPGTAPSAAAGLIAYLLGLRAGDARAWLGEAAARGLDRAGRTGLIERLGEEFRRAWRGGGEAGGGEMRHVPLPWHDGGRVHQASLWYGRNHGGGEAATGGGEGGTRLVVNLAMSRLGQLQIDGLYRKGRFDVVLRSLEPLHEAARRNLRMVFDDALAISGLAGAIEFQTAAAIPAMSARDG